jgi:hypothetical protein
VTFVRENGISSVLHVRHWTIQDKERLGVLPSAAGPVDIPSRLQWMDVIVSKLSRKLLRPVEGRVSLSMGIEDHLPSLRRRIGSDVSLEMFV